MTSKKRMQVIGLAILAVVTAILVIWSLPQVRNPAAQAAIPASLPTPPPGDPSNAPDSPTPSRSDATPTKSPAPTGLAGVSALLNGKQVVSILVLGDGSGNEADEWAGVWAREHLARNHKVTYRSWDTGRAAYESDGTTGRGSAVTVWNASITAPNLAREHTRVAEVWQPADVVFLSYGHRNAAETIGPRLTKIRRAVAAQNPEAIILVMIQNPDPVATEQTQKETTQAVEKWADVAELDSINVYRAFVDHPAPRYQLVEADGSPTPVGSDLWARAVAKALAR